jgi:hypothetical protein
MQARKHLESLSKETSMSLTALLMSNDCNNCYLGAINAECKAFVISAYSSADFDNGNVFNLIVTAGTKVKSE